MIIVCADDPFTENISFTGFGQNIFVGWAKGDVTQREQSQEDPTVTCENYDSACDYFNRKTASAE